MSTGPQLSPQEQIAPERPSQEWIDAVNAAQAEEEEEIEETNTGEVAVNSFINVIIDLMNAGYDDKKIKDLFSTAVEEATKLAQEMTADDDESSEIGDGSIDIGSEDSE